MSVHGVFIGVNQHDDPHIPELNGAVRDATALWALFADSVPDLSSCLLVDKTATYDVVRRAVLDTLSTAGSDDVVVITFAGHGSPDGRLVLSNTLAAKLDATSLSMMELAEAFKATKARAVLCILDCCFSGQAPARVLEVNARPRSAFVLAGVQGEGRIILSACAPTESAWEQPGTGHGILTHAVIQAMTNPPGGHVSFPEIGGEIIRLARLEAERIAVTQTPEFLGSVRGGLVFPTLKRGGNFLAAFPPDRVFTLSGPFNELIAHGIPEKIAGRWTERFPGGLNPLQLAAVNTHGVLAGKSLLVVAPTSSGKTMVGELAAIQAVLGGRKAAFLLPYRALVNEKFDAFTAQYGTAGLRVVRCSGDASDGIGPVLSGRYDLGFFTYETFLNLALVSPRLVRQLGLVVVDEGQFITDPNRGITVELIFALILRARQQGIQPQLIVLSAVLGRLNGFTDWLGLDLLISTKRPVPLIEGVLDRQGTFQFLAEDGSTQTKQLLPSHAIVQRREKPSAQDVIVPLAQTLVAQGEKLIVFRNMRGPAQGCAKYLATELGLPPASAVLAALPTQDLTGASADLRQCLEGGTAFHNTNLLRAEREAVEQGFRNKDGGIHVMGATTTLAAGINTPASTVILAENVFVGDDGREFTVAEYKNMAGRAGRLGFNEVGKAIILAETPWERAQLFQHYPLGTPEDVVSSFQEGDLPTWTLRLLSQVRAVPQSEIPALLVNTFAGYSASRANPSWMPRITEKVNAFVARLVGAGLAEVAGELVHLTLLGKACGESSLSFESALLLVELLRSIDLTHEAPLTLLAVVQMLPEMDSTYTPVMKRGRSESKRIAEASIRYGRTMTSMLQRYVADEFAYWARCKRGALLYDWMEGVNVEQLEKDYSTTPFQGAVSYGDIIRIADATRFHLRSAHRILSTLMQDRPEFIATLDQILLQLEFGLPQAALSLMKLPVVLTRGQYLALWRLGCSKVADVTARSEADLAGPLGAPTAKKLYAALISTFQS